MLNSVTASETADSILDCTRRSSAVALSRSPIFAVQGLLFPVVAVPLVELS